MPKGTPLQIQSDRGNIESAYLHSTDETLGYLRVFSIAPLSMDDLKDIEKALPCYTLSVLVVKADCGRWLTYFDTAVNQGSLEFALDI